MAKFYRVPSGLKLDSNTTALTVVEFLVFEQGNEDLLAQIKKKISLQRLSRFSWESLTWVTKTKKAAKRYGDEVEEINFPKGYKILAEDRDGGFLVFSPKQWRF